MTERSLVYLASPYTHESWTVRDTCATLVAEAAAHMLGKRWPVYCPIAHGHAITEACDPIRASRLALDVGLWDRASDLFLDLSLAVVVVMLPTWRESRGVEREIRYAEVLNVPVRFLDPDKVNRVRTWAGTESLDVAPLTSSMAIGQERGI